MAKKDTDYGFEKRTKTVSFDDEERRRLALVMKSVRQRNKLVDPSKLIKDLMGLTNVLELTEEERRIVTGAADKPGGHRLIDVIREDKDGVDSARKGRRR